MALIIDLFSTDYGLVALAAHERLGIGQASFDPGKRSLLRVAPEALYRTLAVLEKSEIIRRADGMLLLVQP
jgi:hypothetical protein